MRDVIDLTRPMAEPHDGAGSDERVEQNIYRGCGGRSKRRECVHVFFGHHYHVLAYGVEQAGRDGQMIGGRLPVQR